MSVIVIDGKTYKNLECYMERNDISLFADGINSLIVNLDELDKSTDILIADNNKHAIKIGDLEFRLHEAMERLKKQGKNFRERNSKDKDLVRCKSGIIEDLEEDLERVKYQLKEEKELSESLSLTIDKIKEEEATISNETDLILMEEISQKNKLRARIKDLELRNVNQANTIGRLQDEISEDNDVIDKLMVENERLKLINEALANKGLKEENDELKEWLAMYNTKLDGIKEIIRWFHDEK